MLRIVFIVEHGTQNKCCTTLLVHSCSTVLHLVLQLLEPCQKRSLSALTGCGALGNTTGRGAWQAAPAPQASTESPRTRFRIAESSGILPAPPRGRVVWMGLGKVPGHQGRECQRESVDPFASKPVAESPALVGGALHGRFARTDCHTNSYAIGSAALADVVL